MKQTTKPGRRCGGCEELKDWRLWKRVAPWRCCRRGAVCVSSSEVRLHLEREPFLREQDLAVRIRRNVFHIVVRAVEQALEAIVATEMIVVEEDELFDAWR